MVLEKKVMSTQGKGFNYAGSEKKQSVLQMFLLTTDDLIENNRGCHEKKVDWQIAVLQPFQAKFPPST